MPEQLPAKLKVPWGITQALMVFGLFWLVLPLTLVLVARGLSPYLPLAHSFLTGLLNGDINAQFVEVILDALAGFAAIGYYLHRYQVPWSAVGWRKFNVLKALGILLLIFLAFTIGVNLLLILISVLVPAFNANQTQANDFTGTAASSHRLIALLAVVVIPATIEETVFRGFVFPAISGRFGLIVGAIGSSILFGLAHLQANISVYTFFLGLLLCFMYVKLRSIFPGMALHMLNNYLAFVALTGK